MRRLSIGLACILAFIALPTPALAQDTTIVLDDLSPLIAQPGRTLQLSGRIANSRTTPIETAQVRLTVSNAPLTTREEIESVATGASDPQRRTVQSTDITIAPRGQTTFTFAIPFDELTLPSAGTYVVGVDVIDGAGVLGSTRTFLPWFPPNAEVTPATIVWLWPLSDWPARNAAGIFLNDQTPREIAPGGRLAELVRIGAPAPVTWVVDPSLVQAVNAMTSGYQVQRDGQIGLGDQTAAAQDWLTGVREVSETPMWVIPYADIDATASRRAGLTTDVVRSVTSSAAVAGRALGEPVQGGLYWAPFGRLDTPTADLLASAGISTVVLSAAALSESTAGNTAKSRAALGTTFGSMDAVLIDPALSGLLSAPQQTNNDVVLARQRFLAETALIATSTDEPQTIVVGPRNLRWAPSGQFLTPLLRASQRAPWLNIRTLDQILAETAPSIPRDRSGYGDRARNAELSEQYLAQVSRISTRVALLASVVDNPVGVTEPFSAALLRAQSAAWRSEPDTATALLRSIRSEVNTEIAKVQVLTSGAVTFSGDTGLVPVTIQNDLSQPITVGVRLTGDLPGRVISTDTSGIQIEPGRRASVEVEARVVGTALVPVNVQLLTPDGTAFGAPARIEVGSTAYARAASWVVIAAFIALGIFVVVGVTRRIHAAGRTTEARDSDTVGP